MIPQDCISLVFWIILIVTQEISFSLSKLIVEGLSDPMSDSVLVSVSVSISPRISQCVSKCLFVHLTQSLMAAPADWQWPLSSLMRTIRFSPVKQSWPHYQHHSRDIQMLKCTGALTALSTRHSPLLSSCRHYTQYTCYTPLSTLNQ